MNPRLTPPSRTGCPPTPKRRPKPRANQLLHPARQWYHRLSPSLTTKPYETGGRHHVAKRPRQRGTFLRRFGQTGTFMTLRPIASVGLLATLMAGVGFLCAAAAAPQSAGAPDAAGQEVNSPSGAIRVTTKLISVSVIVRD